MACRAGRERMKSPKALSLIARMRLDRSAGSGRLGADAVGEVADITRPWIAEC